MSTVSKIEFFVDDGAVSDGVEFSLFKEIKIRVKVTVAQPTPGKTGIGVYHSYKRDGYPFHVVRDQTEKGANTNYNEIIAFLPVRARAQSLHVVAWDFGVPGARMSKRLRFRMQRVALKKKK